MSELINNQAQRRDRLKSMIRRLHEGVSPEAVQQDFIRHFSDVSAAEIAQMEQELVQEGLPVEDIQKLCDVHAAIFKGAIEDIHRPTDTKEIPGHPVQVFHRENRLLERLMAKEIEPLLSNENPAASDQPEIHGKLTAAMNQLWQIDKHYSRKENLLFPYLERNGVTAPPKVMWGVDDEIRDLIRAARKMAADWQGQGDMPPDLRGKIREACERIREMIFKEENILLPMAMETITEADWGHIAEESPEIGFTLLQARSVYAWPPGPLDAAATADDQAGGTGAGSAVPADGMLRLPSGILNLEEIVRIFDTLPFDVTFVDAEDTVRYFSQGSDRIFNRTRAIIGRKVVHCHPPTSVHVVEKILSDFKSGTREHADFWIHMGPRYVLIRYFAVRNNEGTYLGTLEVTQDIAPIQTIDGDKRLLD